MASPEEEGKEASGQASLPPARSSPKLGRSDGFSNPQEGKPSTDFHNLARDLENNRTSPPSDKEAEILSENSGKRKFSDMEDSRNSGLSQPPKSKEELANSAQQYRGAYGLDESRRAFLPSVSESTGNQEERLHRGQEVTSELEAQQ